MFKKSGPVQKDMFRDIDHHIPERKAKALDDPASWHAVFCDHVLERMDESVLSVLCDKGGRPNAPVRVLLGMMVLKQGNGWSDEQMFGNCQFDLRCMRALGLHHIDDDIPAASTHYEFRRRLSDHYARTGMDLIEESFQGVSRAQVWHYNIKGERVRLDSELIQSNIAKGTRLKLILEAIRKSTAHLDIGSLGLAPDHASALSELRQGTVSNLTYGLDNGQRQQLLVELGSLTRSLLAFVGTDSVLSRVYGDHYREEQGPGEGRPHIEPRDAREIEASSVQSAHDPEATFRSKGQGASRKQVSGYHANVVETCQQDNAFNLITDVEVVPADVCEDAFLVPAIEQSERVLGQSVEHVTTDGGYDSVDNREAMARDGMPHWNMARHKGAELRYKLSYGQHNGLRAFCKRSESECDVRFSHRADKHVIAHPDGSRRYLTEQQIQRYLALQEHHRSQREEDAKVRPNVESTIQQVFHRLLKRDKVKYRGMYKCKMYVVARAYWTNFRRILKDQVESAVLSLLFPLLWPIRDLLGSHRATRDDRENHSLTPLTPAWNVAGRTIWNVSNR